jgi:hypothetical protein
VGFRAKPGHTLILKDYQQEMYVNPLGTINFQEKFDDYRHLIFALGDSYTQGTGLYSDASYPFQLDLLLNINERGIYRKKFAVVNLGLSAFGGEQSLITLRRYIQLIGKPSVVLYLGCDNDYSDDVWFKSGKSHQSIVDGNPYWGWMYYPVKWVFVDMEIGKRLKLLVSQKRLAVQREAIAASSLLRESSSGQSGLSTAELEIEVLQRIIQTAGDQRARVILSWANKSSSYDYLQRWAGENGYAFADWFPLMQSVRGAIPALSPANPHSGGHYRTWVNHLIAREYAKQIKKIFPESEE